MRPFSLLQTDVIEHGIVLAPLGLDPHVAIEKHPGVEEAFEVLARGGADFLDHLAAAADDDRLLRLAIDDDRAVQPQNRLRPRRLLEAGDDQRARERELGVRELEQFLPHDLGGKEALRLIGEVILRVEPFAFRQPIDDRQFQPVYIVAGRRSSPTVWRVAADSSMISAYVPDSPYCWMIGSRRDFLTRSILLRIRNTGAFACFTRSRTNRSPFPGGSPTSTTSPRTSTSRIVSTAASTIRTFIRCSGRWMPGVARKTHRASG